MTIIKFLAIIAFALALTACTGKGEGDTAAQPAGDAAAPAAPADGADAGTEAPADDAGATEAAPAEGETTPAE